MMHCPLEVVMNLIIGRVVVSAIVLLLSLHFFSTIVYVLPFNPTKLLTGSFQSYIQKYFPQDWGMFAPNPVSTNMRVLIKCIGQNIQTPVLDASSGFSKNHKLNVFAAQERIGRVIYNQAFSINAVARSEEILLKKCKIDSSLKQCEELSTTIKKRNNAVIKNEISRTAKVFCNDMMTIYPGNYLKYDLYIGRSPVVRWSERWTRKPEEKIDYIGRFELAAISGRGVWK